MLTSMFLPFGVSLLCTVAAIVLPETPPSKRATICNGHAELCSRSYSNITFIGSHNSFAYNEDPLALARDQEVDVPSQLASGARLLQAQAHDKDGALHFCHTSCSLLDGGTVTDYLKKVKTFLDANKTEVLTLIFTNPEGKSVKDEWKSAFDSSGLTPMIYVPPHLPMKQSEWPTLGEMIEKGKRVVVFLDAGADGNAVDFILPEFDMIWETPFTVTDPSFPCSVNRMHGPLPTEDHMYMINHSLNKKLFGGVSVSDQADASKTNGVQSIIDNANKCAPLAASRAPNFVLLDFVNVGEAQEAVDKLNGFK